MFWVTVLSANAVVNAAAQALGVVAVLPKPFTLVGLRTLVQQYVR